MLTEKMNGATTMLERAQVEDMLLTPLILSAMDARQANSDVMEQTSLWLRLAAEGKDSACAGVAERAAHALRDSITSRAEVVRLLDRLMLARP